MMSEPTDHVDAIEQACAALMAEGPPAVRLTCQDILDRCYLLRWYEGDERDALPTLFDGGPA